MNNARILLKLVLAHADLPLDLEHFDQRFTLQKKVYLLQLTGLDLGYRYNWYLRGPYAPSLARDLFLLKEEIAADETDYQQYGITPDAENLVDQAQTIWEIPNIYVGQEKEWLELLASLHYLKHIAYWHDKKNPDFVQVFERLKESKPHLTDREQLARAAWDKLDRLGLIAHKTLK